MIKLSLTIKNKDMNNIKYDKSEVKKDFYLQV